MADLVVAIDARQAKQGAEQFVQAANRMATAAERIDKGTRKARDSTVKFGNASEKASKQTSQFSSRVKQLATGFTALAAARRVVTTIASFETTMARVQATTRGTAADLERMTAAAREMGATTRFSATQAGEGLLFLSKAGFDATEAIDSLGPSLNLATAAGVDLGQSADILSNIMGQFSIEAAESVRVVDVLTTVSNQSNVSLVQLAESMKLVGPLAKAAGLSLEEAAAALGVLGNAGIQGSLAGTALRGSLITLLAPTDDIKQKMEAAGVSMKGLEGDLTSALRGVKAGTLGFSEAIDIFQRRFASAGLVLSDGVDSFEELTQAAKDGSGAAQEYAAVLDNTLGGAFKSMNSALDEAILRSGDEGLLGVMRATVDLAADVIRALSGVEGGANKVSVAAKGLATVLEFLVFRFVALKALGLVAFFGRAAIKVALFGGALRKVGEFLKITPWGAAAAGVALLTKGLLDLASAQERAAENAKDVRSLVKEFTGATLETGPNKDIGKSVSQMENLNKAAGSLLIKLNKIKESGDPTGTLFEEIKNDKILQGLTVSKTLKGGASGLPPIEVFDLEATIAKFNKYYEEIVVKLNNLREIARSESFRGFEFFPSEESTVTQNKALSDTIRLIEQRNALLKSDNQEGIQLLEDRAIAERIAADSGEAGNQRVIDSLREMVTTERELIEANRMRGEQAARTADLQKEATEELIAKQNQYAQTVVFGFVQGIRSGAEFKDTLRSIADSVADLIIQELILKAIRGGMTTGLGKGAAQGLGVGASVATHRGNVFHGVEVQPFARGGLPELINSPMARVAMGTIQTFGENVRPEGKEAVLPLKRNASGELGVASTGGGKSGSTTNVSQTFNFYDKARDADSFKRNQRSIQRAARDAIRRGG